MHDISIVILTLNEADAIDLTLDALATQLAPRFEVIVVDAASSDGTQDRVRQRQADFPVPLRLEACDACIPIGAARNLGARLARAPAVAYLSADARPAPDWVARAITGLAHADMVFGRQLHTPDRWTAAACVRGLRYGFPEGPVDDPLPLASNVAAVFDKRILEQFPFDPAADAAEDLLLAKRAAQAGWRAHYDPDMVVAHSDVATWSAEASKNRREGRGWARHRDELGLMPLVLAWGAALGAVACASMSRPKRVAALVGVLWAPALRRAMRRRGAMPAGPLAKGVAASPAFDFLFLYHYIRGLADKENPT